MAVSLYEEIIFSEKNTQIGADKVTDIFNVFYWLPWYGKWYAKQFSEMGFPTNVSGPLKMTSFKPHAAGNKIF